MKHLIVAALVTTALTGCGQVDRTVSKYTGKPSTVCYEGVQYLQFTSGASVAYNTDGTVKTCR